MGGMIVGIRREIREKKVEQKREDMIDIRFRIGEEKWRIISVYKKKNGNKCMLEKCMLGRNNRQRRRKTDNRRRIFASTQKLAHKVKSSGMGKGRARAEFQRYAKQQRRRMAHTTSG